MIRTIQGVVHGKSIELDSDPGIQDGRRVEVILRVKQLPGPPPGWKPGTAETAAGMLADSWSEADDSILGEIQSDRKRETRREIPQ